MITVRKTVLLKGIWAAAAAVLMAACATPPSAPTLAAASPAAAPARAGTHVQEYPLVEQSTDNPTHAGFAQRVPAAVHASRSGFGLFRPEDAAAGPNKALQPFGYRLEANPSPPFSGYALFSGAELVQRDIQRFWPVTLNANGDDFLLTFETLSGERMIASAGSLTPWPGAPTSAYPDENYYGSLAYAGLGSGLVGMVDSPDPRQDRGEQEWSDAQDMAAAMGYDEVFGWKMLAGRPFYFYTQGGLTHLHYAGKDLPYLYDYVVHEGGEEMFNPGSSGSVAWFYALRDGLWYYVEISG